ncbi:MAG TPA: hypothetical protein VGI85_00195, partial [Chthoniobacterales bacterium]
MAQVADPKSPGTLVAPVPASWWSRTVPAFGWLRGYQQQWLRLDIAAGITLAAYLLPAALADA